jgi:beta-1,4-mannosyl-glycoprotein beta-1,4-N-acetylglucosaminyltransferase
MTRPLIIDAFPFHDELDILECRLVELYDAVDWFVAVEADVTHQDRPKPYYLSENLDRFAAFKDKLVVVQATGLPAVTEFPDPWAREHAQREHIATGLRTIGVSDQDIVLQSDVDEIPRPLHARNVRPGGGLLAFGMRGHFWAVDWLYKPTWYGTVAGTCASILRLGDRPFGKMRDQRNRALTPPHLQDAGWHLSWLGGPERVVKKVGAFCHPEVEGRIRGGIENDNFFWREGWHVDGEKMVPVDVNDEWPRWIYEGHAPASWYRPR